MLETGCGIGNFTTHLLDRRHLHAVDIDPFYVSGLSRRYGHLTNVTVEEADLEDARSYDRLKDFDSILSVNVLEHLDDPQEAVAGFHRALNPGGTALILVPAHMWLFSAADAALEHRKRYESESLGELLSGVGFEVLSIREFNRFGVVGWWFNKLTGRSSISAWQARLFAWLLPVARLIERIEPLPGLSLVAIARKP